MKRNYLVLIGATAGILSMVTACNNNSGSYAENNLINDSLLRDTSIPVDTNAVRKDNTSMPQGADAKLVYEIMENMYGDIALLQQGQNKSATESLKVLAKKLAASQIRLTDTLKQLATKKGWSVPAGASATDMQNISSMGEEEIPVYEKALLVTLRKHYEANIKKLENTGSAGADVKAPAQQVAAELKELLKNIKAGR